MESRTITIVLPKGMNKEDLFMDAALVNKYKKTLTSSKIRYETINTEAAAGGVDKYVVDKFSEPNKTIEFLGENILPEDSTLDPKTHTLVTFRETITEPNPISELDFGKQVWSSQLIKLAKAFNDQATNARAVNVPIEVDIS